MAERRARQEKARQQNRSAQQREQRHQRGLQYKCKTAAEMCDSCKRERARLLTVTEARRAAREAAGVVGKRSRPISALTTHQSPHVRATTASSCTNAMCAAYVWARSARMCAAAPPLRIAIPGMERMGSATHAASFRMVRAGVGVRTYMYFVG